VDPLPCVGQGGERASYAILGARQPKRDMDEVSGIVKAQAKVELPLILSERFVEPFPRGKA